MKVKNEGQGLYESQNEGIRVLILILRRKYQNVPRAYKNLNPALVGRIFIKVYTWNF